MIIATTLFVALLATIDLTIVAVALPYMAGNLNATSDEITWVVTMFAVGQAIVIGLTGHLSRMLGRKTLALTAVSGFVATSVACGLSTDLDMIVFFRFIQGLFSGPLVPLSQAILIDAVEEDERAKMMSFWIIGTMGGPAIGPLLGGYLAQELDWRWNFWVNLPVGVVAIILILTFIRRTRHQEVRTDWLGLGFLALCLSSLQIALNQGDKLDWFGSLTIIHLLVFSLVAFLVVIFRGIYLGPRHIIDVRLFRDFNFTLCCSMMGLISSGMLGLLILSPLLFVDALGWEVSTAGVVIGFYGVGGIVGSILASRVAGVLSMRAVFFIGCMMHSLGWYLFSRLDQNVGFWQAVPAGMLIEFGMLLVVPILAARAFANLEPRQRDEGAGLFNLTKTIGFSFGATAVGTLFYQGQLINWTRYVGNVDASNPALLQYLDDLGSTVDYDTQVAYVAALFETQMQVLTITQIAEKFAFATFILAFFAIFFGEPKPKQVPRTT